MTLLLSHTGDQLPNSAILASLEMDGMGIHLGIDSDIPRDVAYLKHVPVAQNQTSGLDHDPFRAVYSPVDLADFALDQDRIVDRSAQPDAGLDHHATGLSKYLTASGLHGEISECRLLLVVPDQIPVCSRYGITIELGGVNEIVRPVPKFPERVFMKQKYFAACLLGCLIYLTSLLAPIWY
jgi:hypothetical protein